MDNLATALALLGGGWTPVPLNPPGPKGKQPVGKWMDLQSCPPTEDQVCDWLEGTTRNVGIVTGRASGVVVIDVDDRDELAKLRQRGLPQTIATTTAKGMHLFFAAPAFEVGNTIRLLPGVDVRGEGGYVVAPPSVHESGVAYEWVLGCAPWDWDFEAATLPAWIEEELRRSQTARVRIDLSDPRLQPGEAWHGGPPALEDLCRDARMRLARGDFDRRYKRRGPNRTFRMASGFVGEATRQGLGVEQTIRLLASVEPSPREVKDGKGWFRIEERAKGRRSAELVVARQYLLNSENFDALPAMWEARTTLAGYRRSVLLGWPWRLGDAARLRVLTAAFAIAYRAGRTDVAVSTRQVAELANVDQSTASRHLHWIADDGFANDLGFDANGSRRLGFDVLGEAPEPYTSGHSMSDARLHALLHPAFWSGGGLNVVAWLSLPDDAPLSAGDLAKHLHTKPRTLTPHLRALASVGLAEEMPGGWIATATEGALNRVAHDNGGLAWADEQREHHRQERIERRGKRVGP